MFFFTDSLLLFPKKILIPCCFFFSSRRRHTRFYCDWSSDVCSSDLAFRSGPIYSPSLSALGSAGGNLSGRALAQIAAQFGVDARALIPIITAFGGAVGEVKVNSASASEGEVPLNEPIYEFQNFSEPLGLRK